MAMMCNIIILAYGIRAHFRFQELISEQDRLNAKTVTVTKLRYYRNMNKLFMVSVFVTALGMLLLVSDGLIKNHPFTTHKVIFDLIFAIIIYAHALVFVIVGRYLGYASLCALLQEHRLTDANAVYPRSADILSAKVAQVHIEQRVVEQRPAAPQRDLQVVGRDQNVPTQRFHRPD